MVALCLEDLAVFDSEDQSELPECVPSLSPRAQWTLIWSLSLYAAMRKLYQRLDF